MNPKKATNVEWIKIKTPFGVIFGTTVGPWQFIRSYEDGKYVVSAKKVPNQGQRFDLGEFDSIQEIEDMIRMFISIRQ